VRNAVCKCLCSGKDCQLLRQGRQTKQLEISMTVLSNIKNEQLLFLTLDFKPWKRGSTEEGFLKGALYF
jgi:hypothetical protein